MFTEREQRNLPAGWRSFVDTKISKKFITIGQRFNKFQTNHKGFRKILDNISVGLLDDFTSNDPGLGDLNLVSK